MPQTVSINGVNYDIPNPGETAWGQDATDYLVALSAGLLQKAGGTFTLTADTDFGATYGLKSLYYKSRSAAPASAGQVRLGNNETIGWRNQADSADVVLKVNTSDELEFNGGELRGTSTQVKTDGTDPGLYGVTMSASCGEVATVSNSFSTITNLSVTITTGGRPVKLALMSSGGAGVVSYFRIVKNIGTSANAVLGEVRFLRDGATVVSAEERIGLQYVTDTDVAHGIYIPPSGVQALDNVAAGTYTYATQYRVVTATVEVLYAVNMKLVAYEI